MVNPRDGGATYAIVNGRPRGAGCEARRGGAERVAMMRSVFDAAPRRPIAALVLAMSLAACGPNIGKADAYEQLADGLMVSNAYPAAIEALEHSLKYDNNEPRRWLKLGRAQRATDQFGPAAMSYQHALDLDPANIEALENMSILMVRAGRYTEARSFVDPLIALSANDVAGLLALGAIAMYGQNFAEANTYADRLIRIAPNNIGGYSLKAHVLEAQGRPHAGAAILAQQAKLATNDSDLALQLMDLYRKAGNVQGVRDTALALAKLLPDDPRYAMESVRALYARGQLHDADVLAAKLQQRYRGNPDVIRAIATFWLGALPRPDGLRRVVAMTDALAGRSKAALADLLVDEGQAAIVARLLGGVVAQPIDAANSDEQAIYARALLSAGRADEARAAAEKVLAYDGTNDVALVVRARTSFARGDRTGALNDAQLAVSSDPSDEEAALLVPRIFAALGSKPLAEKAWGDAQAHLPDSVEVHRQRTAWLVAEGRTDDALQIAATFARAHDGSADAWRVYAGLCAAAADPCAARADARLKAFGRS